MRRGRAGNEDENRRKYLSNNFFLIFSPQIYVKVFLSDTFRHPLYSHNTFFDLRQTPLHIAASRCSIDVCSLLISHGADVNERDVSHCGVSQGRKRTKWTNCIHVCACVYMKRLGDWFWFAFGMTLSFTEAWRGNCFRSFSGNQFDNIYLHSLSFLLVSDAPSHRIGVGIWGRVLSSHRKWCGGQR